MGDLVCFPQWIFLRQETIPNIQQTFKITLKSCLKLALKEAVLPEKPANGLTMVGNMPIRRGLTSSVEPNSKSSMGTQVQYIKMAHTNLESQTLIWILHHKNQLIPGEHKSNTLRWHILLTIYCK